MTGKNDSNKFIKFVSFVAPKIRPFAAKDKDGKDIYVYDAKLMSIIAEYLGARYEILTPPDGEKGARLPDGNWTGMIGMVQRQEADLVMSHITMTEGRFRAVNYSYPIMHSTLTFMTDSPEPMPKNLAIFYPFSYSLWIALAALSLAMSLVFYVLLNRRQPYQRVLLNTVRSVLADSIDFKTTNTSFKMAAFAWILGMFVVTNSYKAILLSFLSFPTMIGIRDIAELSRAATTESFKCITFAGSYMIRDFAQSDEPSLKAIGECLLRNEEPGDAMEHFLTAPRGKAFVANKDSMSPYERRYFVSEDSFFIGQHGIPLSKTFCCKEDLNRIIHRFHASGIFEKLRREQNFFIVLQTPTLTPTFSEPSHVINLTDMTGAFYVLFSGWVAGIMIFLIEIFVQKIN